MFSLNADRPRPPKQLRKEEEKVLLVSRQDEDEFKHFPSTFKVSF